MKAITKLRKRGFALIVIAGLTGAPRAVCHGL